MHQFQTIYQAKCWLADHLTYGAPASIRTHVGVATFEWSEEAYERWGDEYRALMGTFILNQKAEVA